MRIIAGRHKGRTLKTPTWDGLRPTSDRVRETLFNVLRARIEGARQCGTEPVLGAACGVRVVLHLTRVRGQGPLRGGNANFPGFTDLGSGT